MNYKNIKSLFFLYIFLSSLVFIFITVDAVEDLTGYTESDALNRLAVTSATVNVTLMENGDTNTYLVYDYGVGGINGFRVDYESTITYKDTSNGYSYCTNFAVSNELNDINHVDDEIGLVTYISDDDGHPITPLFISKVDGVLSGRGPATELSTGVKYYFTVYRIGGAMNLSVYNDSARTDLRLTLYWADLASNAWRYFYVAQSGGLDAFGDRRASWENSNYTYTVISPPTDAVSHFEDGNTNISWTKDANANTTVLVQKSNTYPTSVSDGSLCYNGTGSYYLHPFHNETDCFSLFSYNDYTRTYTSGVEVSAGGLIINVYDENTSLDISSWGVVISNYDGSNVYTNISCSNPTLINYDELPTGLISILINSSGYNSRIYVMSIVSDVPYFLDAYLPSSDITQLCRIDVVGPQTEYGANPPVEDTYVKLSEYDNVSGIYQPVSMFYTDANGQYFIQLGTNKQYLVNITKSGYNNEISTFIVQPDVYVYTFRLTIASTAVKTYDSFAANISFICTMVDAGYMQLGNITINYNDLNSSTVNTHINIIESFNSTDTVKLSYSSTSNTLSLTRGSINTSRDHYVMLYFNNTADFIDASSPFVVYLPALYIYQNEHPGGKISINDRITNLIGPSPFVIRGVDLGWHNILAVIPALFILVLLGPYHAGIAIVLAGIIDGATSIFFEYMFLDAFPTNLVSICPLLILIGILYIWVKRGGEDTF